jgi:hypothetical protein
MRKEILNVKEWHLGFWGRLFGAKRYYYPDGKTKKMSHGAFEILNLLANPQTEPSKTKTKLEEILSSRAGNKNMYHEKFSRHKETKDLYTRLNKILNDDNERESVKPMMQPRQIL